MERDEGEMLHYGEECDGTWIFYVWVGVSTRECLTWKWKRR